MSGLIDNLLGDDLIIQEDLGVEKEIRLKLKELPLAVKSSPYQVIEQGFIYKKDNKTDIRIRKTDDVQGNVSYTMTAKYRPMNVESETEINKEMYQSLWNDSAFSKQHKTRYLYAGWDVDVFEDGTIIAEYEYDHSSQIHTPKDWQVIT